MNLGINYNITELHKAIGSKLFCFYPNQSDFEELVFTFEYFGTSNNHQRVFNLISRRVEKSDMWTILERIEFKNVASGFVAKFHFKQELNWKDD